MNSTITLTADFEDLKNKHRNQQHFDVCERITVESKDVYIRYMNLMNELRVEVSYTSDVGNELNIIMSRHGFYSYHVNHYISEFYPTIEESLNRLIRPLSDTLFTVFIELSNAIYRNLFQVDKSHVLETTVDV